MGQIINLLFNCIKLFLIFLCIPYYLFIVPIVTFIFNDYNGAYVQNGNCWVK